MKASIKILLIFGLITLILGSFLQSPQLFLLLPAWYVLGILALLVVPQAKEQHFLIIAIAYPYIELCFKLAYLLEIPNSWIYLNRAEHFLFSALLTYLLYAFFLYSKFFQFQTRSILGVTFLAIGTASVLGIGNEVLEFIIREYKNLHNTGYYADTIYDLLTNIFGTGAVGIGYGITLFSKTYLKNR